jgi:hypothetical protein
MVSLDTPLVSSPPIEFFDIPHHEDPLPLRQLDSPTLTTFFAPDSPSVQSNAIEFFGGPFFPDDGSQQPTNEESTKDSGDDNHFDRAPEAGNISTSSDLSPLSDSSVKPVPTRRHQPEEHAQPPDV